MGTLKGVFLKSQPIVPVGCESSVQSEIKPCRARAFAHRRCWCLCYRQRISQWPHTSRVPEHNTESHLISDGKNETHQQTNKQQQQQNTKHQHKDGHILGEEQKLNVLRSRASMY